MKKSFLVLIALFSFTLIFSQQAELIKHLPQHTNGYLVLENFPGATVSSWTIDIIQNTYQDFKLINQKVIYTYRLIGRNYFKIPKEYLEMENLSIKVYAYLENGETLTREDILTMQQPGGGEWEYFKSFKCVGSTYAFEIKQFKHNSTDKSYLRVDGTAEQTDPNVVYYYRYFPLSVWQTMTLLDDVYYPSTMNQPLDLQYYHGIGNMLWNQGPEVVLLVSCQL